MNRILLAEDDDVTRETVAELLAREELAVTTARDGREALARWNESARHQPHDLVLLDIMMPGLSGYDVCRRIRRSHPQVPILFLSAKSEEVDVVLGLELGADDFLRKPFGKHELLARVRKLLRRGAPPPATSADFRLGPWQVMPRRLLAHTEDGRRTDLTPREILILQLLASRPDEVVSRDELLNRCWGLDYFPESRTLDQHILNLRKKIEADPSRPRLIETVRGAGYRFSVLAAD